MNNLITVHSTESLQIWQSINLRLEDPTKSCDHLITWLREKIKHFYLHFNSIYCSQTWQSRGLGWGTPSPKSHERLTKWLRGHYLLNVLKASVAIILKMLSLLSVVLRFLDNNFDTIFFNFQKQPSIDVLRRRCSGNMKQISE